MRRWEWRRGERPGSRRETAGPGKRGNAPEIPSCRHDAGFTYLELVVVIAILAVLFFFSLPRLDSFIFTDPSKKVARLIASTVQDLKQRALKDRKEYRLYIATDTGQIWVGDATMDEKAMAEAREGGFSLPSDMWIQLPGYASEDGDVSAEAVVRFYPKGYSDPADILLVQGEKKLLLVVEPFLSRVEVLEEYGDSF